jgi:hypothetical protein
MRPITSRTLEVSLLVSVWLTAGALAQNGTTAPTLEQSSLLSTSPAQPDAQRVYSSLTRLQIPFVANDSRMDPRVSYYAPTFAGTVFVTRDGKIVYSLPAVQDKKNFRRDRGEMRPGWTLTETLVGGKSRPRGDGITPTHTSLFIGNDPARWKTNVETYDSVSLGEVWPGVDVRLRAYGENTEKVFTVRAGANPSRIRLRFGGARSLRVNADGALVATTGLGDVTFTPPVAYQESVGAYRKIDVAYEVSGDRYGFRLGNYDPTLPVVIDPILQATYLGGGGNPIYVFNLARAMAIHPFTHEVYVAGTTWSSNFPGTAGGAQASNAGWIDAFVARLNANLTVLIQATYLGGSGAEYAYTLAIHPTTGEVYVAGDTFESIDFPGTAGGAYPTPVGRGFAARLSSDLTRLNQATYLPGYGPNALAIHPTSGEIYTASLDAPDTSPGVVLLQRLSADLTRLYQATRLAGRAYTRADPRALSIDPVSGDVYVAGSGVLQAAEECQLGGFIARLDATLTAFKSTTCLAAEINALAIHPTSGQLYAAGYVESGSLTNTVGGAQATPGGGGDAFVARLSADLTRLYQATYLGGDRADVAYALAAHPASGGVYVAGRTGSTNFPGTNGGAQATYGGEPDDAFVALLNSDLTSLTQATYLGGDGTDGYRVAVAIHPTSGEVYVAGSTDSFDFPATAGGAQPERGDVPEAFVARLTANLAGEEGGGLRNLSPFVSFNPIKSTFSTTRPTSACPAGAFIFNARLTNTSSHSLSHLVVKVTTLTNGDLLQNADGGPDGAGAVLTIPASGAYADGVLGPGESIDVSFAICMVNRGAFNFLVDVLGESN